MEAGRPTYLVEYGEVSFANRGLGMEHWVDEVDPPAIEEVSAHAGGRPVHVVGWSLGGIFALLTAADRPDLPIGSLTSVGAPVDVTQVPLVAPIRPFLGITGERAGLVTQSYRLMGGVPQAAGPAGLPALVVQQAGDQADRDRRQARRRRLPRPGGGRRPVHREHDRLPRPDVRAALPPAAQGQPARVRVGDDGRPGDQARRHHRAAARVRRRRRRHRTGRSACGRSSTW